MLLREELGQGLGSPCPPPPPPPPPHHGYTNGGGHAAAPWGPPGPPGPHHLWAHAPPPPPHGPSAQPAAPHTVPPATWGPPGRVPSGPPGPHAHPAPWGGPLQGGRPWQGAWGAAGPPPHHHHHGPPPPPPHMHHHHPQQQRYHQQQCHQQQCQPPMHQGVQGGGEDEGDSDSGHGALLQYLMHKAHQLRCHRLQRNVVAAWKQVGGCPRAEAPGCHWQRETGAAMLGCLVWSMRRAPTTTRATHVMRAGAVRTGNQPAAQGQRGQAATRACAARCVRACVGGMRGGRAGGACAPLALHALPWLLLLLPCICFPLAPEACLCVRAVPVHWQPPWAERSTCCMWAPPLACAPIPPAPGALAAWRAQARLPDSAQRRLAQRQQWAQEQGFLGRREPEASSEASSEAAAAAPPASAAASDAAAAAAEAARGGSDGASHSTDDAASCSHIIHLPTALPPAHHGSSSSSSGVTLAPLPMRASAPPRMCADSRAPGAGSAGAPGLLGGRSGGGGGSVASVSSGSQRSATTLDDMRAMLGRMEGMLARRERGAGAGLKGALGLLQHVPPPPAAAPAPPAPPPLLLGAAPADPTTLAAVSAILFSPGPPGGAAAAGSRRASGDSGEGGAASALRTQLHAVLRRLEQLERGQVRCGGLCWARRARQPGLVWAPAAWPCAPMARLPRCAWAFWARVLTRCVRAGHSHARAAGSRRPRVPRATATATSGRLAR